VGAGLDANRVQRDHRQPHPGAGPCGVHKLGPPGCFCQLARRIEFSHRTPRGPYTPAAGSPVRAKSHSQPRFERE
jgi:hypothetical protein